MKTLLSFVLFCISFTQLHAQLPGINFDQKRNVLSQQVISSENDNGETANRRFHFYSLSNLNSTENLLQSLTGSQKFAALVNLFHQDSCGFKVNKLNAFVSANALYLNPASRAKDSIDLVSLMFPETGNAGFQFALENFYCQKNGNHLSTEVSFSLRQVKFQSSNDSTADDKSFTVLNYNIVPIKYSFNYKNDDFNGCLTLSTYYNLFNIPNEDAEKFNDVVGGAEKFFKNSKNSMIHSAGLRVQANLNNFIFFMDARNNFTKHLNLPDDNPYKGFVFNAGFTTAIDIFSR